MASTREKSRRILSIPIMTPADSHQDKSRGSDGLAWHFDGDAVPDLGDIPGVKPWLGVSDQLSREGELSVVVRAGSG